MDTGSSNVPSMELAPLALASLTSSRNRFLQDLEALPETAFTHRFGEATRTVADIVYEVNLVNDHVCMVLRNEEPFEWPDGGWIKAPADFQSKQTIVDAFRASSESMLETVRTLTEEDMPTTVETEQGPMTRYQRCQFMSFHMSYHDGQINFIQTMLGDQNWHWG